MTMTNGVDLLERVRDLAATMTMREVAAGIGVTHFTVWKFLGGRNVLPSTRAKIQAWVDDPADSHAAADLKAALRRLVGRFGHTERMRVEREVGDAVRDAYRRAHVTLPSWVRAIGRAQAGTVEPLMEAKLRRVRWGPRAVTRSSD